MKKNKKAKKKTPKEKFLYIDVEYTEHQGPDERRSSGPYSGFCHTVINIINYGPFYFSEEGRGYESHRVNYMWGTYNHHYTYKKPLDICSHPKEEDCQDVEFLYTVVVRYGDGGTFGRTDGRFAFPFISLDEKECKEWIEKNSKRIIKAHDGHFDTLETVGVEKIGFAKDPNSVSAKRWWTRQDLENLEEEKERKKLEKLQEEIDKLELEEAYQKELADE